MAAFHFELVSPEKLLFSGDVESVVVPSVEGEFMVMANHAPVMASLRPGVVTVAEASGKSSRVFVRGGFADVSPRGLTILAEEAAPVEQFDAAAIEQQIKNAEEDLADAQGEESKRIAAERLSQLRELRTVLKI